MSPDQLALDLSHRPAFGREDFLVAPCNRAAVALLDSWPAWPAPAAAIHGAPGCGKSHLAAVWRARAGGDLVDAAALAQADPGLLMAPGARCVVEVAGAGVAGDRAREEALLHLYNRAAEGRGFLLIVGREPPARWPVALADLGSRLAAIPSAAVGPPDDALIGALLVKLFADRQLRVGRQVIAYMLPRMERSFEAARRLVEAIDRAALAGRRNVTVPLVRSVLGPAGR